MAFELTEEQRAAVENRGGTLLVSAAAGSGKTRVLVERLMGYVEEGRDIDRFLVITFTNAAAAELRERISAAIQSRLAIRPEDRQLRRSAARVYQAKICWAIASLTGSTSASAGRSKTTPGGSRSATPWKRWTAH